MAGINTFELAQIIFRTEGVMRRVTGKMAMLAAVVFGAPVVHATTLLEDTFQIPASDDSGAGYSEGFSGGPGQTFTGWYAFADPGNGAEYDTYPSNLAFYEAALNNWGQGLPSGFTNTTPTSSTPTGLDAFAKSVDGGATLPGTVYWAGIASNVFGFTTKSGVSAAGINSNSVGSLSFQVNTFDETDYLAAAIQVNGSWFYSQATVESTTELGANNTSWQTDIFNVANGKWAPLSVTLGNSSGGSSAKPAGAFGVLPAGNITGIGWYEASKSGGPATGNVTGYDISDYVLSTAAAPSLIWNNSGYSTTTNNGVTWDIANNYNWSIGGSPTDYVDGSSVTFNDSNNGNYNVTLNTTVSPGAVLFNNSAGNYSLSGAGSIGGSGSLTKSGTDTVTLSTANTYSGGTTITAGTLVVAPTSATTSALPRGSVTITGGTLQLASNVTAGSQTGTTPASNVNITSLSITGNGTLDVGNNHILIDYTAGNDPISSIAAWITSGYAGGAWTGKGIKSTSAAANAGSYGLGYADSADPGNPAGLPSDTIEIKYTLLGDANLDGKVNGTDFAILASNFNQAVTSWDQGDFNYDGKVNGTDFAFLASNFNQGANQADLAALDAFAVAHGLTADVPEPAGVGVIILAQVALSRRRSLKLS